MERNEEFHSALMSIYVNEGQVSQEDLELILSNIEKYEDIINKAIDYMKEKDKLSIYDINKILGI